MARSDHRRYRSAIVTVDQPSDTSRLVEMGAVIWGMRGNMVLACLPTEAIGAMETSEGGIGRVSLGRKVSSCLDKATAATGAGAVVRGEAFPLPYSGRGVTVGFSDTGFDAGHVAFRGRVGGVSHYVDSLAERICMPAGEFGNDYTDTSRDFHATHVGGILAGDAAGSRYGGVAPGADIFASTSILYDVGILAGVEDVIAAAKKAGQPAVVNLSLGSLLGPRDGTDAFSRYLDLCGEEGSILIAAGNDGHHPCTATRTLGASSRKMAVLANSTNASDLLQLRGLFDVWSSDGGPMEVRLGVWDILESKIVCFTSQSDFASSPEALFRVDANAEGEFGKYFAGTALAAAELCPDNSRYNLMVKVDLRSAEAYPGYGWSRYSLIVEVEGMREATLDLALEGDMELQPVRLSWSTPGTPAGSINGMACGRNTLAVGSYTSAETTPLINGGTSDWTAYVTEGQASRFSSYGRDFYGRPLPQICAPGAYIVSAMSRQYVESHPQIRGRLAAENPQWPGHLYYAECGTSMATPHAAGVFALWLEADPTLTPAQLRDIATRTARADISDPDGRCGAGLIDAVAGLREILSTEGIGSEELDRLVVFRRSGSSIVAEGCQLVSLHVYDLQGRPVDPDLLPAARVIAVGTTVRGTVVRKML